jgi:methylmalonyl-CoA/ethylmalonyl-CoA epimerase
VNVLGVHHAGLLVPDHEPVGQAFREVLGLSLDHVESYGDELEIAFYPCGDVLVEVITPTASTGWNASWLARTGPAIQHLAFEVADIAGAVGELRQAGRPLLAPAPRPGAGGTTIAFIEPAVFGGILVELVEDPARQARRAGELRPDG